MDNILPRPQMSDFWSGFLLWRKISGASSIWWTLLPSRKSLTPPCFWHHTWFIFSHPVAWSSKHSAVKLEEERYSPQHKEQWWWWKCRWWHDDIFTQKWCWFHLTMCSMIISSHHILNDDSISPYPQAFLGSRQPELSPSGSLHQWPHWLQPNAGQGKL